MGSWDVSCGLTNIEVSPGDDVMLYPIRHHKDATSVLYVDDIWDIMFLPLHAQYDDYGLYRLIEGKDTDDTVWNNMNLSMILKYLNDHINEFEQGENQYHDIPVKKGKVDWELISEAVREDRLHVGNCNIQLYPVHKSAHDELLEIYKEHLQKQIDRNRKTYSDYVERCSVFKAASSIPGTGGMGSFLIGEIENNLIRSVTHDYYGMTGLKAYTNTIVETEIAPTRDMILCKFAEASVFLCAMTGFRKAITPQPTGQCYDFKERLKMLEFEKNFIEKRLKEWEEFD